MRSIGIMQGRLTQPKGRGIQFFPFDNWIEEFKVAKEIGLKEIEFIFDYDNYKENPLWQDEGQSVKKLSDETGIQVKSVCFDYFMRRPFFKYCGVEKAEIREENEEILKHVLRNMNQIGSSLIEIPLVDDSSLRNKQEAEEFREFLLEIAANTSTDVLFGLETDLPPQQFKEYLDTFGLGKIGANYDSGNSSGIGYLPYEEVTTLKDYIFNVHIKDRVYQGTTVQLGTGSADFKELFRGLKEIDYQGSFILQAARGQEGSEEDTIRRQMQFLSE